MDLTLVGAAIGLFVATYGLIVLCEKL